MVHSDAIDHCEGVIFKPDSNQFKSQEDNLFDDMLARWLRTLELLSPSSFKGFQRHSTTRLTPPLAKTFKTNNEDINVGPTSIPQLHSLEEKAIWKLPVILDSMECPDYAFETIM